VVASCDFVYFVDRVLRIRSQTIHEITLSYMKDHEIRVFVQSLSNYSLFPRRLFYA